MSTYKSSNHKIATQDVSVKTEKTTEKTTLVVDAALLEEATRASGLSDPASVIHEGLAALMRISSARGMAARAPSPGLRSLRRVRS